MKGSIEAGKLADLVVLDGTILSVESDRIKDLQVETTIIDGEIVYRRSPTLTSQRAR
jgi:predicted amidohydrolase YtcJ